MFKVEPVFKDYIWGGNKLKEEYGKKSDLSTIAESWELSTHPAGICKAKLDGRKETLTEYLHEHGKWVLGDRCKTEDKIPILIKLIDARDNLSVQVHPDDAYAIEHEKDLGKTEMWYVLEAEEGAQLIYGFKKDLSRRAFEENIEHNTLSECLNYVNVHKGDVFLITPGTIHAIGKGIVIAEIQESSNVTYRVYDYGRVGADGRKRQLHIKKALEVTNLHETHETVYSYSMLKQEGARVGVLASCDYFTVRRIQLEGSLHLMADEHSFHDLLVIEGEVKIKTADEVLIGHKGESFFIPAHTGSYELMGKGEAILSTL